MSPLYDVVVIERTTGKETSRFPAYSYAKACELKRQSEPSSNSRFVCIGICWRLACDCKLHDGENFAPMPPLHDGCCCVHEPEPRYTWHVLEAGTNP